jgi:hypothetical protein
MSATLTWASSGAGTKTGTSNQLYLDDLSTLITSKAADSTFYWEVAGSNTGSTPRYLLLRRKSGSAGRIGIIIWDSNPAANNTAILDQTPVNNAPHICYFPNGTGTTLSNLTSASGTICGNDSGVIKCASPAPISTVYTTSFQHFYFDNAEGMVFMTQNPASASIYAMGAGAHIVDGSDNAYDCVFASSGTNRWDNFTAQATTPFSWTSSTINAGSNPNSGVVRTNYGASNRAYFHSWIPAGNWCSVAASATDIMSDTANQKNWFLAFQLLGQTKGEGQVLKWRQIAAGPGTLAALEVRNTTGPVVAARQGNLVTTGSNTAPWFTNFKC